MIYKGIALLRGSSGLCRYTLMKDRKPGILTDFEFVRVVWNQPGYKLK
jgi:hypothetical protein